jgi:hypothetical protein
MARAKVNGVRRQHPHAPVMTDSTPAPPAPWAPVPGFADYDRRYWLQRAAEAERRAAEAGRRLRDAEHKLWLAEHPPPKWGLGDRHATVYD